MKFNAKAQKILETLDPELLSNMMKLYEKLNDLSAEIQVHKDNPIEIEEQYREEYAQVLSKLSESLNDGINGINYMTSLISHQDEESNKEFLAGESMQEFRRNIEKSLLDIQDKKYKF